MPVHSMERDGISSGCRAFAVTRHPFPDRDHKEDIACKDLLYVRYPFFSWGVFLHMPHIPPPSHGEPAMASSIIRTSKRWARD